MTDTAINTETPRALAIWYLSNIEDGKRRVLRFNGRIAAGERDGQAFYNTLPESDQGRIVCTIYDPFHHSSRIPETVEFLTRPEK